VILEKKGNEEGDYSDESIAFIPNSGFENAEGEDTTSPPPDLGNHFGAQVATQRFPVLRMAQTVSARPQTT
jgi:hypothetical protein